MLILSVLWLPYIVRLGIDELYSPVEQHGWLFVVIPLFICFGRYLPLMRLFGNDALITIIKAATLSSLILAGCGLSCGTSA